MSSAFAALNVSETLTALDAEEHTRELQIEEAFKVFQTALKFQKELQFQEAREGYKELFRIDVISNEATTSPTIRTLRYLAHRNRGLLYFEELHHKINTLEPSDMIKLLDDSVDDLVMALLHTDGDNVVVNLLLAVFKMFGKERLLRYTVEYELTKEENEELLIHSRKRGTSSDMQPYLKEEQKILHNLGIASIDQSVPDLQLPDLTFLTPVQDFIKLRQQELTSERQKFIKLSDVSIQEIAAALALPLSKTKAKYHRFMDGYQLRDDIIVEFKFEVPVEKAERAEKEDEVPSEETLPAPVVEIKEDNKRPIQDETPFRSSKRMRTQEDEASNQQAIEISKRFLAVAGSMLGRTLHYSLVDEREMASTDFTNCLNNWTPKCSAYLLQESSKNNADVALVEIINSNTFDEANKVAPPDHGVIISELNAFILDVNSSKYSYHEVRMMFLKLVLSRTSCGFSFMLDYHLDKETYSLVESFVVATEDDFPNAIELIAVVEVLLEYLLRLKHQTKVKGTSTKHIQDLETAISYIDSLFNKWLKRLEVSKIDSAEVKLRIRWCKLLYSQHQDDVDLTPLHEELSLIHDECNKVLGNDVISFANYDFIPSLSTKGVKAQKDKLDLINTFEKTLSYENGEADETAALLEALLLDIHPDDSMLEIPETMTTFINNSPIGLQLRLWKNLLNSYSNKSDLIGYSNAISTLIPLLLSHIAGEDYYSQMETQRIQTLLTVIGSFGNFADEFVKMLVKSNWNQDFTEHSLLQSLISMLEILYPFCAHEVLRSDHKSKFITKLQDIVTDTLILIIIIHIKITPDESRDSCLDFLSIVHEELGRLKFCDASSGRFLKLSQHILRDADPARFGLDILQHLNCRFHISVSAENFTPFNHDTLKTDLDKESALQFSEFLFGLLSKKKDPLQSIPKPDLKSALDNFYEAVGDPDYEDPIRARNQALLEQFFSQSLDLRTFRDCFWSESSLKLMKTKTPEQIILDKGLYYLEAAAGLNVFKSRRKQAQGKASDLEQVVKLLKADLTSGSNRMESWLLLGEAYSLQVEDDLTWTSDKLNSVDKKRIVASTQKLSLLSYSNALNIVINSDASDLLTSTLLCGLFAKELYYSLMKPLEGFAYLGAAERTILTTDGLSTEKPRIDQDKVEFCLKLVLKLLRMAIGFDGTSWTLYYYLAKVLHKLNQNPIKILNMTLQACSLSSGAIEPHYLLCSLVYKYFTAGKVSHKKGIAKLREAKDLFDDLPSEQNVTNGLSGMIILALKKLLVLDKKKWHHRPRFRIAMILHDLGEYNQAVDEMDGFVLYKSMSKSLINIWKPDMESPGKHFVYTHQYCLFYLDLLEKTGDFQRMSLFIKKLRRFGPSMVDLPGAWDRACSLICTLTKSLIKVYPGYTDWEVPKLLFSEFTVRSQKLSDILKEAELSEKDLFLTVLLYEISEVRRMNNGFGATSLIDDTLNSVYLKLYLDKMNAEPRMNIDPEEPPKDSNIKSKVARRDIINTATSLVKVFDAELRKHRISDDVDLKIPEGILPSTNEEESHTISPKEVNSANGIKEPLQPSTPPPNTDEPLTSFVCSPSRELPIPQTPTTTEMDDPETDNEIFHTPQGPTPNPDTLRSF